MKIKEFIIMPHTADPMGLIHKPGVGPNNRFDFKNKGNNKANEDEHSPDLKLPTGKKMVLQAEDNEHTRGLVITSNEDGSYDSYYWYDDPKKAMPIEVKEEAAGVGIVTKQNATKDVPVGGEYMNVKKLGLGKGKPKTMREEFAEFMENFADGKRKGKSRPGRVKRAGASCKGSVTSLRSKAKKASGERAKMYHWCANMKSGRKKKK